MIVILIPIVFCAVLFYFIYQSIRNEMVYHIRDRWIDKEDDRWDQYSYEEMLLPSRSNWFGLRVPKDWHFPNRSK